MSLTSPLRSVHQHKLPQISTSNRLSSTQGMAVKAVAGPMSPKQVYHYAFVFIFII